MKPVIYIDVLFFVNFFINFAILYTTAKIGRLEIVMVRLLITSAVGALYAVCMFFPDIGIFYSSMAKIISSLGVVALAFNIRGVRLFFKTLGIFFLVTLCFGGCAFAVFCFTDLGSRTGAVVSNGIVYLDLPWQLLGVSTAAAYFILSRAWRAVQNKYLREYVGLTVALGDNEIHTAAIIDTGNTLCEPVSMAPVVVVEYKMIKGILPEEISKFFERGCEDSVRQLPEVLYTTKLASRVRLIPFSSLGTENGMLVGFKPDSVTVRRSDGEKKLTNVIIGVYGKELSKDNSFHALLNPEIL